MKRLISTILIPTTAAYLSGCLLAVSSPQPVVIVPSHPNAEVYVDGTLKGIGLVAPGAWELLPTSISVPVPDASACDKPAS